MTIDPKRFDFKHLQCVGLGYLFPKFDVQPSVTFPTVTFSMCPFLFTSHSILVLSLRSASRLSFASVPCTFVRLCVHACVLRRCLETCSVSSICAFLSFAGFASVCKRMCVRVCMRVRICFCVIVCIEARLSMRVCMCVCAFANISCFVLFSLVCFRLFWSVVLCCAMFSLAC